MISPPKSCSYKKMSVAYFDILEGKNGLEMLKKLISSLKVLPYVVKNMYTM